MSLIVLIFLDPYQLQHIFLINIMQHLSKNLCSINWWQHIMFRIQDLETFCKHSVHLSMSDMFKWWGWCSLVRILMSLYSFSLCSFSICRFGYIIIFQYMANVKASSKCFLLQRYSLAHGLLQLFVFINWDYLVKWNYSTIVIMNMNLYFSYW